MLISLLTVLIPMVQASGSYQYTIRVPIDVLVDNYTIRMNSSNQTLLHVQGGRPENYSAQPYLEYIQTLINITDCQVDWNKVVSNDSLRSAMDSQRVQIVSGIDENVKTLITNQVLPAEAQKDRLQLDNVSCKKDLELKQKDIDLAYTARAKSETDLTACKAEQAEAQTWDLIKWAFIAVLVVLLITDGGRDMGRFKFW